MRSAHTFHALATSCSSWGPHAPAEALHWRPATRAASRCMHQEMAAAHHRLHGWAGINRPVRACPSTDAELACMQEARADLPQDEGSAVKVEGGRAEPEVPKEHEKGRPAVQHVLKGGVLLFFFFLARWDAAGGGSTWVGAPCMAKAGCWHAHAAWAGLVAAPAWPQPIRALLCACPPATCKES